MAPPTPYVSANLTFTARLPASYMGNERRGVEMILNDCVLRYDPRLGGVLIAYDQLNIETTGSVHYESPFVSFRVVASCLVLSLRRGTTLRGIVTNITRHLVTLTLHDSIPVVVDESRLLERAFAYKNSKWVRPGGAELCEGDGIDFTVEKVDDAGGRAFTIRGSI